jgi:hypothetical protein
MFISSSPTAGKRRTKAGFTVLTSNTVSSVLEEASGILSAEILIHPSAWKRCSPKFALLAWECGGFVVRVSWARAKGVTRCTEKREEGVCIVSDAHEMNHEGHACCGPGYASPKEAMKAEREKVLYTVALYVGTGVEQPDYLATVDVDPESPTYSRVVERTPMPNVGDELHHFGWNACSSCHDNESKSRRFLVVPGERSGRIHIIDTQDERAPKMHKVIEPEEIIEKTNLSAPHTVHCLPDRIMISMVGDGEGNGPGGFLLLDEDFNVAGRWEKSTRGMRYNYDFWYQLRHNVMVSSEWAAPSTYRGGFDPKDVARGQVR